MVRSDRRGGTWVSAPFAFLLFACLAAACSAAAPQVSLSSLEDRGEGPLGDHYRIVSDEAYGPHERQRMDLYLSRDVERLGSMDLTIIFLHGGGFSFGDKADNQRYIQPFLQKGLDVVSVNYRIGEGIPLATEDLTLAFNYLRRDAEEHGLRLDRVVAGGFSAGGQIASTVGFSQGSSNYPFPLDEGIRVGGASMSQVRWTAWRSWKRSSPAPTMNNGNWWRGISFLPAAPSTGARRSGSSRPGPT